jgi:hypothetical protein
MSFEQASFTLRFTYRTRSEGWYLDIVDANGNDLARGRRLSASWGPILGMQIDGAPAGIMFVRGPSRYTRDQLNEELQLLRLDVAEITPTASAGLVTVTIA